MPRISTMPWTAPIFDDRQARADPQLVCMASLEGLDAQGVRQDASCRCLTEQGTAYELSQPECRTLARNGPVYNPYRERRRIGGTSALPRHASHVRANRWGWRAA